MRTESISRVREVNLGEKEFPTVQLFDASPEDFENDWRAVADELRIIGEDPVFVSQLEMAAKVAPYPTSVLILGENGTGKDGLAEFTHRCQNENIGRPYVPVNAAGIPETLFESHLFGHEKGSFTGANNKHIGYIENANGGTIFIDEIGEMPVKCQAKLLRTLQNQTIQTVGSSKEKSVNVRVIAATNLDVEEAVKSGQFREDLYHRFDNEITLPPLRNRTNDLLIFARYFLEKWNSNYARKGKIKRLSKEALKKLSEYHWPGNIRELKKTVEQAAMLTSSTLIDSDDISFRRTLTGEGLSSLPDPVGDFVLPEFVSSVRREMIERAVKLEGGRIEGGRMIGCNQKAVADRLGIKPQAINQELKKTM